MQNFESKYFTSEFIKGAPGQQSSLMIVLHGLGDSLQGYQWLPSALNIPGLQFLLVNAPDPYYGGYSWYDFTGNQEEGIRRSRTLLFELLKELEVAGIKSRDIYLFGFSQGCLMSLDVGLRWPNLLRGVCGVSGYLGMAGEYPKMLSTVASSQKFLLTHGLEDPVVPFETSAKQYSDLEKMGLSIEFKQYSKVHTILPDELEYIRSWVAGLREEK